MLVQLTCKDAAVDSTQHILDDVASIGFINLSCGRSLVEYSVIMIGLVLNGLSMVDLLDGAVVLTGKDFLLARIFLTVI